DAGPAASRTSRSRRASLASARPRNGHRPRNTGVGRPGCGVERARRRRRGRDTVGNERLRNVCRCAARSYACLVPRSYWSLQDETRSRGDGGKAEEGRAVHTLGHSLTSRRPLDYPRAAASGVLLALSFPSFGHPAFAWIALAPLLISLRGISLIRAFLLGLTTGLVYFTGTLYWITRVMVVYGSLEQAIAVLVNAALVAYLALFPALFAV